MCYDVYLFGVEFYDIADGIGAVLIHELNQQVSLIRNLQVGIIR